MTKRKLLKLDTACKGVEWLFKLANYRLAVDIQAISLSAERVFSSAQFKMCCTIELETQHYLLLLDRVAILYKSH